jgi:predicted O-linked N-acetylglucosamine transferase (SPINDLY family)
VGIPVLTLQGESFASRVSSSLLNAVELNELITHSSKEYEDKAVDFFNNLQSLKNIKKKLEINIDTKPLFNTKLFTKHIEQAYLEMQNKYNENKKPENIEIK